MLTIVLGGSGSGKSSFSEDKVSDKDNKYYIATMQVYGEEGYKKVERHHKLRAGKGFVTIEQKTEIDKAVNEMKEPEKATVLLECMSNLVANEMFRDDAIVSEDVVVKKVMRELRTLMKATKNQVIVSNDVFEDGFDYDDTTKAYMRALGKINAEIVKVADEAIEIVAGIPLKIKG